MTATPAIVGTDRLHGTPGRFTVSECRACGSGGTLPPASPQELAAFYPGSYNAYALPAAPVLRWLATLLFRWRYWRGLRRSPLAALVRRPPGRLLDVGGGRGDLGVVLQRRGWRVTSLDPSEHACAEARRRGVAAVCGTMSDPSEIVGPFDAVVFQHSLEHVVDPAADLAVAHRYLAEGGLLIVTLPNFGCAQRRWFKADWFHLDLPRHRSHFTADGLGRLLRRSGFEDVELSCATSADGLPMSVQYRLLGGPIQPSAVRYLVAGAGFALAPAVAALNALTGGGDILHALAVKAAGEGAAASVGPGGNR